MNCKECIHEDVCKEWQYSISGSYIHPICRKPNHFKRKDKEQVRHGKWIENYGAPNVKRCSVCKAERHAKESWWRYCPKCGAKMRGENNE